MSQLELNRPDRLQAFANRLKKELGVSVTFRGLHIYTDWSQSPPRVVLPNMERALDKDVSTIIGLCLHEAAHCAHTDIKACELIKDYIVKAIHVALEDDRVDRAIDRDWEGARQEIINAMKEGARLLAFEGAVPALQVPTESFLDNPEKAKQVMEAYRKQFGILFDVSDERQVRNMSEILEVSRFSMLWLHLQRGYSASEAPALLGWSSHPWARVFEEETKQPAKSTKHALYQAMRIAEKIGVNAAPLRQSISLQKREGAPLADMTRPYDEAMEKVREAEQQQKDADALRAKANKVSSDRAKAEDLRLQETPEYADMVAAKERLEDIKQEAREAYRRLKSSEKRRKEFREKENQAKDRRDKFEASLKAVEAELKKAEEEAEKRRTAAKAMLDDTLVDDEFRSYVDKAETDLAEKLKKAEKRRDKAIRLLQKAEKRIADMNERIERAAQEHSDKKSGREQAEKDLTAAMEKYAAVEERISNEVDGDFKDQLEPLQREAKNADERARKAALRANELLNYIKQRDETAEAPLGPGAMEKVVEKAFDSYKDNTLEEELSGATDGEDINAKLEDKILPLDAQEARTYVAFTREYDRIVEVDETTNGRREYEKTAGALEDIIEESRENLSRLYSPTKTDVRANVKRGSLDSRHAYRIAMAARGAPVDVRRVWKELKHTRTPQVAVSLLLDSSRSMLKVPGVSLRGTMDGAGDFVVPIHEKEPTNYCASELNCGACIWKRGSHFGAKVLDGSFKGKGSTPMAALRDLQESLIKEAETRMRVARKSVVALSEVMRAINIPYEVLGHSTDTEIVPSLDFDGEDFEDNDRFSRFAPFVGYVFKGFGQKEPPASIFSDVSNQDNLDGEAIAWAGNRLALRPERTKILIALCDGVPFAKFSNNAELARHLYQNCKAIEAFEKDGLFLFGLGIDSEKVGEYFKNHEVLNDVKDLPKAVLSIVEHVLVDIRGTMA